ncbi:MAG: fibronectin type III domain-containing protein [Dehalococcoidia bacterium]
MKARLVLIPVAIIALVALGAGTVLAQPEITDVQVASIGDTSATITWATEQSGNSVVNYGTTSDLDKSASDASLVTSHSITLTGLSPDTEYLFEVQSTDEDGNTATDNNNGDYYTFTTTEGGDGDDEEMTVETSAGGPDISVVLTETPVRRAFVGVVDGDPNGSVTLIQQGTGELVTIMLDGHEVKTPGGPRADAFTDGARVVVQARQVNGLWEAVKVVVKPKKPPFPLVGAVVSVDDGIVTIMRRNGTTKTVQLPPGVDAPGTGALVTAFAGPSAGEDGEEDGEAPPVVTGLMRADEVRERLGRHLGQLADDPDLPGQARGRLVADLATTLDNFSAQHIVLLETVRGKAPAAAHKGLNNALANAHRGRDAALATAAEARAKAGPHGDDGGPQDTGDDEEEDEEEPGNQGGKGGQSGQGNQDQGGPGGQGGS